MTERIVAADWVEERLDGDAIRVVDVREAWEYDSLGHLPGAANVPFDSFRDDGDADVGHLPGAEAFADCLGDAGIDRSDRIVAYDDTNGVFAARFVVTALVYGFEDVHLLNGDFSAWQREYDVEHESVSLPAVENDPLRVEEADSPLVDAERVREAIDGDGLLLDTRDQQEFEAGHLPGAVRFDWQEAVDPETRGVTPRAELRELFEARGVTPDRQIVLYCNTARRLSHTYCVLRWLGFEDVGIYEGSLTEWREIGGELVTGDED